MSQILRARHPLTQSGDKRGMIARFLHHDFESPVDAHIKTNALGGREPRKELQHLLASECEIRKVQAARIDQENRGAAFCRRRASRRLPMIHRAEAIRIDEWFRCCA